MEILSTTTIVREKKACTFNLSKSGAHNLFNEFLYTLNFSTGVQKTYDSVLKMAFATEDATRNNRIKELQELINENLRLSIDLVSLFAGKKVDKEEYDLLLGKLKHDKISYHDELATINKIETNFDAYITNNTNLIKDFKSFFWKANIDSQHQLLDSVLDGEIIIVKEHIQHIELNPNFKRLLRGFKTNVDNEESCYLQQSVHGRPESIRDISN